MTKFLNISTDNTLGGNSPSNEVVSSQKALKEYIDANSGGASDGITVNKNSSNQLQAIGLINKNTANGATNPKYDWVGTLQEYQDQTVATSHPDWICYITDDVSGGTSVYTKNQVNNLLSVKANSADVYTETETNELLDDKADTDLSNLTSIGESHFAKPSDLTSKANTDYSNCSYTPMRSDVKHITETYVNGTSWYRVYSDGWCEQGGKTGIFASSLQTFTLLKAYKNTVYSVVFGAYHNQGANSTWSPADNKMPLITVQYTSSFKAWCRFEGKCGVYWKACGYIS